MIASAAKVAERLGARGPGRPHGPVEFFWLKIFAPLYHLLPEPLRRKVIGALPGSHKKSWPKSTPPLGPAV